MIRKADFSDFDKILDLCEEFWGHTSFNEPFERLHTLNMVKMSYDHGLLAVLEIDGVVEGFCAAIKSFLLGSTKALTATELAWWVNEDHRRGRNGIALVKFMESLAENENIKYFNMASMESSMPEKVNKMYERMNYKKSETVWTKVI